MAQRTRSRNAAEPKGPGTAASPAAAVIGRHRYCAMPVVALRPLPAGLDPARMRLIRVSEKKWVSGTVLHYSFFRKKADGRTVVGSDGKKRFLAWSTSKKEMDVVRAAFEAWRKLGIGLSFKEVTVHSEAEVRIGFERDDGAWSYIGRDVLDIGVKERTMNFGWNLLPDDADTALHEIGHTLGFPHEHQNPNAGIEWDEEAVYADLAADPNFWDRDTTFDNIIRKIPPDEVQGSSWDPDSIMEYPFSPGLIKRPERYFTAGLQPAGGLSLRDRTWVQTFYPLVAGQRILRPYESVSLELAPGEQAHFSITPTETREYSVRAFGSADMVIVLFEYVDGTWRYLAGNDDSGKPENASLTVKLFAGRKYELRLRMYAQKSGQTALMLW